MMNSLPFGGGCSLALPPVDMNGGVSSKWAAIRDVNEYLAIAVVAAVGAAASEPVITLQQATDNAGAGAIALGIKSVHYKVGAPTFDAATDVFIEDTAVTREAPAASYDSALTNCDDKECVFLILVRPIDLAEGYTHLRVTLTSGASKVAAVTYTVIGKAYQGRSIVDVVDV